MQNHSSVSGAWNCLSECRILPQMFSFRLSSGACGRSSGGFTLIEILVAISVLSIALVVILQLFSGGLKAGRRSETYTKGVFHAREKMEEILLGTEFVEGVSEGEFEDDYRWQAEIIRLVDPDEEEEPEGKKLPVHTYNIKLNIFWQEGENQKRFMVSTTKLVKKDDETGSTGSETEAVRNP